LSTASVSSGSGAAFYQGPNATFSPTIPSPQSVSANPNQQSDSISTTAAAMVGTGALLIGAGAATTATYFTMRDRKSPATPEPITPPATPKASVISAPVDTRWHDVQYENRIDPGALASLSIYPTEMQGHAYFPSPLSKHGPRFHPKYGDSNCAVHAQQMLVNGHPAFLVGPNEYMYLREGGRYYNPYAIGKTTQPMTAPYREKTAIIHPSQFAEVYRKNIDHAILHNQTLLDLYARHDHAGRLNEACRPDFERRKAWRSEISAVQSSMGNMERIEYPALALNEQADEMLSRSLNKLQGRVFVVASPLIPGSIGETQRQLGFLHHYFNIEEQADGTWIKRDALLEKTIRLELNGQPARNALQAFQAEHTWRLRNAEKAERQGEKITFDKTGTFHIFTPCPR
jgi:hypothetical protein